jgi:hypothetical protein
VVVARGVSRSSDDDELGRRTPAKQRRNLVRRGDDAQDEGIDPRDEERRAALHEYRGRVVAAFDHLGSRACGRLAALWLKASGKCLEDVREELGFDARDAGRLEAREYRHGSLAAGLFLVLFLEELKRESRELLERRLVEQAYLPGGGGTDKSPYVVYRLPDELVAERVLGARVRGVEVRERLKGTLVDILEGWWSRYGVANVSGDNPRDVIDARLVRATFTSVVYDAFRVDTRRPAGRREPDFKRWRGESVKENQKPRGRKPGGSAPPSGPASGSPTSSQGTGPRDTSPPTDDELRAYARQELPASERSRIADYLLFQSSAADIERFEEITRTAPDGADVFERVRAGLRALRDEVVKFLPIDHEGIPEVLMLDADESVGEGILPMLDARDAGNWIVVFARVDFGPPFYVERWTPVSASLAPYFPPEGAEHVELLAAVVRGDPVEHAEDPVLALRELEARTTGDVRWSTMTRGAPAP